MQRILILKQQDNAVSSHVIYCQLSHDDYVVFRSMGRYLIPTTQRMFR